MPVTTVLSKALKATPVSYEGAKDKDCVVCRSSVTKWSKTFDMSVYFQQEILWHDR